MNGSLSHAAASVCTDGKGGDLEQLAHIGMPGALVLVALIGAGVFLVWACLKYLS